jgi:Na+/H+ antiporter NhaD/arsenite permease-like protein
MSSSQILGLLIFLGTYVLIISERVHRLKAALLGISAVLLIQLVEQTEAFSYIDFNTIGLLIGMMILVGIIRKTGMIQYVAIKAVKLSAGNPWLLLVMLSGLTAVISALIDNVTTILLIGPIALAVSEVLRVDPMPFIFAEIFSSNIGGTATLIGDPPNLLIGSAANLSFNDFVFNLGPAVVLSLAVMYLVLYLWYGKELKSSELTVHIAENFKEPKKPENKALTTRISLVMILVLAGFVFHGKLGLEAATIALSGATLGLLLCPVDVEEMLKELDWVTILFFSSLFMLVGSVEHLGLIRMLAESMISVVGDHMKVLSIILIWGSGVLSAIVDNVPYTAAMIPLVRDISSMAAVHSDYLWWSLALGACLGGNGTLVGASANLVMAGIAEKDGIKIDFRAFLARGSVILVATLVVTTIYVFFRYL